VDVVELEAAVVEPVPATVVVVVEPVPATVVVVVEPVPATVVVVVDDVAGATVVLGSVVVAIPVGSSTMNVDTALRAAAGGCGITVPFGTKAIVISSPLAKRMPLAFDADTT
jgi:hypothetical protein